MDGLATWLGPGKVSDILAAVKDRDLNQSNRQIILKILGELPLVFIGLAVSLGIGLNYIHVGNNIDNSSISYQSSSNVNRCRCTAFSAVISNESATGTYSYAAVVADSKRASEIGTDIMARKKGNAIDAAVASLFATGIINAHSCGLGGGSVFVIYDSEKNEWHAINAKATAPGAASEEMYVDDRCRSFVGGKASGVPGEVMGLWEIHRRLGKLPWSDVVRPSIKLCQEGIPLTDAMNFAVQIKLTTEKNKQDFAPYFDENGDVKPVGSLIKLPKLAKTFQAISDDPTSFYKGRLAEDIVSDIQEAGGIITLKDLKNYKVKWTRPTMLTLPGDYKLYSIPAPGGGPILSYILSILAGYNMKPSDVATIEGEILTYHRIIEAFKFAYGKGADLGDDDFVDVSQIVKDMTSRAFGEATRALINDSHTQPTSYYKARAAMIDEEGTSHLSVIDGQGNVVAVTSSIHKYFGNRVRGNRTGIVFNNEMNDFTITHTPSLTYGLPVSPANAIRPGKRPLSSMSPAIVWDENQKKVRMVTGAAGGIKIPSVVAKNIIDVLWLNRSLPESVDLRRFHHHLVPSLLKVEEGFSNDLKEGLKAKGHEIGLLCDKTVIQAIDIRGNEEIVGTADFRKGGKPMGI
ncbi:gamma-glutamyltranspeptidase 1 [Plakobranchus ocellatus]|uniref:Gamma-glutamyltranspeptidase 1 n=1 Tax=Plakobranchus ocellatus TaxID=259542 RepID=A0AAV4CY26_9GAST|nr:gamma-glutamyltranspeptidase 1 [Plakobranchus ocellatus]